MRDDTNHLSGKKGGPGGGHAVVIGGSMAGLLAARVLSDHFARVTVIERDRFPEEPVPRRGVPQAHQLHVLLRRGRVILERLFPGLGGELVSAGCPVVDMANDLAWLTPAGWGTRFPSELALISFSRDLLDFGVRRRLSASGVCFLEERDVLGLLPGAGGVAGVRVRSRAGEEEVGADLVVDATGRGSLAPRWLAEIGYPRPEETTVDAHLGYASRLYARPPNFRAGWKGVYVQVAPPDFTRGGVLFPIEGDRWMATLVGGDRDYPPTDERGFMDFARSLRAPTIHETLQGAEPLTPVRRYRATENRRRHYERLSRMPENFLVTGDAACAFNPVYGQGMTTAALGAEALEACLRGDLAGLSKRFQKKLAKVNAAPWMLATGEDYRYRGTEGGTLDLMTRFMHRYMDRVMELSTGDAAVRLRLLKAFNLIEPPTTLFHPYLAAKVLRREIPRRSTDTAPPAERELPGTA